MSLSVDVQCALSAADAEEAGPVPRPQEFRRWIRTALRGRCGQAEISIRIVGAREGADLNRRYRRKAGATNVLSFPVGNWADWPSHLLGDIVICAPVVLREARLQAKAPLAHWAHLTVHGALHLLGYDHVEEMDAELMERLERDILVALDYPDPYAGEDAVRAVS